MSLRVVHAFFIGISILFFLWFGVWILSQSEGGMDWYVLTAVAAWLVAGGLSFYLINFLKGSSKKFLFASSVLGWTVLRPETVWACAMCQGNLSSPLAKNATVGIWVLLVVICGVLLSFASMFFLWFWRSRSRLDSKN